MTGQRHQLLAVVVSLMLLLVACSPIGSNNGGVTPTPSHKPQISPTTAPVSPTSTTADVCPAQLSSRPTCFTPHALRVAYGVESLIQQGFTGKGQTIVDIVSFGSPTIQQDIDVFDQQFGLPPITIQVLSPLDATVKLSDPHHDRGGWAIETELDVEIIHAMAPDAGIIVMTSPVAETEGVMGFPEFMKLQQYAVDHHLGQIFSQSYAASEVTLADSQGQQLIKSYNDFYKQITTQQGWTILSGSGDNGATDYADLSITKLSPTRTVNFPADVPWVTAVGGTTLFRAGTANTYNESAWSGSGGGVSKFFTEPDFQHGLPQSVQSQLAGQRGLPDIAADADPTTGMAYYINGRWRQIGGTSASTPLWAGIIAIANQVAGHPLGFINPGLYKVGVSQNATKDFRDITQGNNDVNDGNLRVKGFQAVAGWDAVTGWGAPQASSLIPDLIAALK
jgi:subtilase family serine protease